MKNLMKKLSALILAAALILTVCSAMAENAQLGTDGTVTTEGNTTLSISKKIVLHNDSLTSVFSPNITYTFEIEPATVEEGSTVTDSQPVTSIVTQGVADGVTLGNDGKIEFTSAETAVSDGVTGNLIVNIDLTKFSKPGVYRYKLTETTTDDALKAAGITRSTDYHTVHYLDVYVHYSDDSTPELEVYGYVLAVENKKVTNGYTTKSPSLEDDDYYTFNITIEKVVTGSMGDRKHEFPFTAAVSNNGLSYYANESAVTVNDATNNAELSFSLKHGDKYYISGLSPLATIAYTETNDTADTYVVSISTETSSTGSSVAPEGTKSTDKLNVSSYSTATVAPVVDNATKEIVYTNNLDEVSPTGVVMRVAPYILILCAGVALLALTRRGKKNEA